MENSPTPGRLGFLKLIADDTRWQILLALTAGDLQVNELIQRLHQPQNLVSYHLQKLRQAHLIQENHSQADARAIYYHLDVERIQNELRQVGVALLPTMLNLSSTQSAQSPSRRVLFICTHNSARSQMAEGLLRAWGNPHLEVFSAGSDPQPVHHLAVQVMQENGIDIHTQQSKGLEPFAQEPLDYVITVCDRAREVCPTFQGSPTQIHWSIPDPAAVQGPEEERLNAFRQTFVQLAKRIQFFLRQIDSPSPI